MGWGWASTVDVFPKQRSHTLTCSSPQPRSGTGFLLVEHASQTPPPQARQWCLVFPSLNIWRHTWQANKLRHFFKLIWLLNLSQPKFGKKWRNLEIFNSCYLSWFWLIKKQEFLGVYKYKAQLRKTTRLQLILPCIFSVVQMMTFNLLWYCQVRGFARMNRGGKFHIKEAVALRQWRVLQDNLA